MLSQQRASVTACVLMKFGYKKDSSAQFTVRSVHLDSNKGVMLALTLLNKSDEVNSGDTNRLKCPTLKFMTWTMSAVVAEKLIERVRYKTDLGGTYRFTDVWAKRNGQWQIVAGHESRIDDKIASWTTNNMRMKCPLEATYQNFTKIAGVSNEDDTSLPALRDDNPQSGGSGGKVYDLDAPGQSPQQVDTNTYRYRGNFYAYATLPDGTRISPYYGYYVHVSCRKTSSGFQFIKDVANDNQIGPGSTPITWNFQ